MGLREQAELDLGRILENRETGFGWPIVLTDPQAITYPEFIGQSTDIGLAVDPETGLLVSGRAASIALRISSLYRAGLTAANFPKGMPKNTDTPWVVQVKDINANVHTFKVVDTQRDAMLGLLICKLESYKL